MTRLSARIAVTGTPGTGKTSVCSISNWQSLSVKELAEMNGCLDPIDHLDDAAPVDVEKLSSILKDSWSRTKEDVLIDGHLSHHLPVDAIIILRCHPETLGTRLGKRNYSEEKIRQNTESELLGIIASESFEITGIPCLEIDSSANESTEIFQRLMDWLADGFKPSRPSVAIDWIQRIHGSD